MKKPLRKRDNPPGANGVQSVDERDDMKPFALQLYERYARGESVEQLAAEMKIPVERIAMRLRAAELYLRRRGGKVA